MYKITYLTLYELKGFLLAHEEDDWVEVSTAHDMKGHLVFKVREEYED